MIDEVVLALGSPQKTVLAGRSLASTLYRAQAVYLTGDVGAGKTTFLQGLSEGFSLLESVSSPTFALARPHADQSGKTAVTHVDLYRLDPAEAATFMRRLTWDGVLWVEWADRLDQAEWLQPSVHVHLADAPAGRTVTVRFMDVALPSPAQIETWRRAAGLPPNIIAHCETVGRIAEQLGRRLLAEGRLVRPHFLRIAGQLHDLLRFLDFQPGLGHVHQTDQRELWETWKTRFPGLRHEAAAARFLHDEGFAELATAIRTHGALPPAGSDPLTIEQQLVFYADKRAIGDRVVSVTERMADFQQRYGGHTLAQSDAWMAQTLALEQSLFPEGPPDNDVLTRDLASGA